MSKENKLEDYFRSLRDGLSELGQKVNKAVEEAMSNEAVAGDSRIIADVYETADLFIIEMEFAGVSKEEINLEIVDGVLNVSTLKNRAMDAEVETYHRRERRFGALSRSFPLPAYVESESIKAKFDKHVLSIRFPKIKSETEVKKSINID